MQFRSDPRLVFEMAVAVDSAPLVQIEPASSAGTAAGDGVEEFGRAVIESVLHGRGLTLSLEVGSQAEAVETSLRLELFLLSLSSLTGGSYARVAPELLRDTYPAMLALTRRLERPWAPEGGRVVRVGAARLAFVSVDRPVRDPVGVDTRPDRLLEVVGAERIDRNWFTARVAARAKAAGLTTVFYGVADSRPSLFTDVKLSNVAEEARDGVRRHFAGVAGPASESPPFALAV